MGKLVRDRIPEIIRDSGGTPAVRVLDIDEYSRALRDKLLEESTEAAAASEADLLEELADVIEVVTAMAVAQGHSLSDVMEAATAKARARGRFEERLYLEA